MLTTNVMRILEKAGIKYEAREYEYDENDLSGLHAAQALDLPAECVFKTLVAEGDNRQNFVFVIPVCEELDLKKCAGASGSKSVNLIHVKALQPLTGYIRGGCSPIGMKKKLPTYIDETALLQDRISVSAGHRGVQVLLSPSDLILTADAHPCDLIRY
ncbi:MAG: Cys-tRNA(Pro) deacylase [Clostridia bacterium]|nr:Cys-tRNA(Pro) deacylase [Clostridia bacterium]